jgi:hypothetical protein
VHQQQQRFVVDRPFAGIDTALGDRARKLAPILSTSSSGNSGFEDFALRMGWMTVPGIAPT